MGDVEAVQSSVGTFIIAGAIEAAGTSGEAASSSQSDSHPPRISWGDPILVVYSLETHASNLHHFLVSFYLLFLLPAFLNCLSLPYSPCYDYCIALA